MASPMEARLVALHDVLQAALPSPIDRNLPLPERIPGDGLVTLWDGTPGEPDVTMPLTYHYDHIAEVYLYAQGPDQTARVVTDALRIAVSAAIVENRTLGGLCDWVDVALMETDVQPIDGAAPVRVESLRVTMTYATTTPI